MGLFHNLDAPQEETGYLSIHLWMVQLQVLWTRFETEDLTVGEKGVW